MAATPYRATCTIDGKTFDAVEILVAFTTEKDAAGMPQMGSLKTNIRVVVDFHDDQNMPFGTLNSLFQLANVVTRDKIKDMKLEYWKDDSKQDALCSYKFKGWIGGYQTCNPAGPALTGSNPGRTSANLNHMLVLELEPVMNQQNFQEISFSN
jgi:hypothetical protein